MDGVIDNGLLTTLQSAQAGNANGTVLDMSGAGRLVLDVVASGLTGTVNFEGTVDGSNWFAVGLKTMADGAAVTTVANASGVFKMPADVTLLSFRARTSGVSAGTVTVKARKAP